MPWCREWEVLWTDNLSGWCIGGVIKDKRRRADWPYRAYKSQPGSPWKGYWRWAFWNHYGMFQFPWTCCQWKGDSQGHWKKHRRDHHEALFRWGHRQFGARLEVCLVSPWYLGHRRCWAQSPFRRKLAGLSGELWPESWWKAGDRENP